MPEDQAEEPITYHDPTAAELYINGHGWLTMIIFDGPSGRVIHEQFCFDLSDELP